MTMKQYMEKIREIALMRRWIRSKRTEAFDKACVMSKLTDMPRAPGSAQASRIEPSALRLLDLERREQRLLKASEKALVKAARLIARVEKDRLRAVLALRYLDGQGWPEIAATLNLSQKTTWNLHGEAMQVLENVQKYET